jgi:hypothetical protein
VGAVTPLLTFIGVEVATGHYSVGGIIVDAIEEFIALLLATITGIIPFVVLSVELYVMRNHPTRVSYLMCSVGLVGVTGLTVLGNIAFWYPIYSGEHVSSTSGLVFLFIPIYGCMAAAVAFIIGLAASLIPRFRRKREDDAK